jgi:AraC family transcriptional regulator, exoenzyme S synthesis regulatory protein ExsA
MEVYQLPEFLSGGKDCEVFIHHYQSAQSYSRNKIKLNKHLICILVNGTKEVFGSNRSVKINNTEILVVAAGNVLMWESIAERNNIESLLIFFGDDFLKQFFLKYKLDASSLSAPPEAVTSLRKDDYLLAFEESLRSLGVDELSIVQRLKVEELLLYFSMGNRRRAFHPFLKNALHLTTGNKFRDVISANADKGLSVEELAFLCNMSISTFKRHFQKTFGCSPQKYFTALRMERAKELLLLEKRPSEIYLDLAYQNLSSFSNEFKKHFGVSPKQFQTSSLSERHR